MRKDQLNLPMYESDPAISCCAGKQPPLNWKDPAEYNWTAGLLETVAGPVVRIKTTLDTKDIIGTIKARCSFGRMNYIIPPALYALGDPDCNSPVLVSANYKLSFDSLRRELTGINLWVLVIDTKGINVWCAAGKGSFGTAEVTRMIGLVNLGKIVSHRTLILPQLAAPGVAAHEVRSQCGFKVIYGPVRAEDLPKYLDAGNRAEPKMRQTTFNLAERLVLAPVELVGLFVPLVITAAGLFVLNFLGMLARGTAVVFSQLPGKTLSDLFPFLMAMLVGIIILPALLPYIPGRALAWKGWVLGILWATIYSFLTAPITGWLNYTTYYLTLPAITAFLGMNFTGSTTYTSLSGVVKEMSYALPLIIISAGLGLVALIAAYFI